MSDFFEVAYKFTSKWEGGVCDVPGDRGGKTAYGISSRYHPEMFEKGVPTKAQAKKFFYKNYWLANKLNEITNPVFAVWAFDLAVNSGKTGVKQFQLAINDAIRCNPIKADEITTDGIIGKKTISATKKFKSAMRTGVFNSCVWNRRKKFYKRLAKSKNQEKFLDGWLNRVQACYDNCLKLSDKKS